MCYLVCVNCDSCLDGHASVLAEVLCDSPKFVTAINTLWGLWLH